LWTRRGKRREGMPSSESGEFSQLLAGRSFQKVDGMVALETSKVIFDSALVAGDKVELFRLPDGRTMLSKADPDSSELKIERISKAYIYFDPEIKLIAE
jgi:hypothetical protein